MWRQQSRPPVTALLHRPRLQPRHPRCPPGRTTGPGRSRGTNPSAPQADTAAGDLNLVGPEAGEPPAGAMAEGYQHDRQIISQIIQAEVQNTLNQARSLMGTDPDAATQQMKLTLEKVRQTAELNPEVRDQYVDLLQTALREAARRKVEVEHARQQRLESAAAAKERLLITENLTRNQEKVKQLMERFNSLMDERRWRPAEQVAAGGAQGHSRQSGGFCRPICITSLWPTGRISWRCESSGKRALSTR